MHYYIHETKTLIFASSTLTNECFFFLFFSSSRTIKQMYVQNISCSATVVRVDEYGIEQKIIIQKPASLENYATQSVIVPEPIGKWLRPHQREGVLFMYECVMGLKGFNGQGCILADDMGLGKTLQSVALIVTLLRTGITAKSKEPTAKRVIVVCPCSLVKQWNREFEKWLGEGQGRM